MEHPQRQDMAEDEITAMKAEMMERQQEAEVPEASIDEDDVETKFNLTNYDDEDDDVPASLANMSKDLMFYDTNADDPNLQGGDEDDSDEDDFRILSTDGVLVAARKGEDDFSHLQVYVYEEKEGNLYEHHDIILGAFPLAVEWIGAALGGGTGRNFAAIATFEPVIEIWDLDVLDVTAPTVQLGGEDEEATMAALQKLKENPSKGKKKKNKTAKNRLKGPIMKPDSHQGPVLGLSWNTQHESLLASSSADTTVKLWDVSTAACKQTYEHHEREVQSIKWNPVESTIMLSGSMDSTIAVLDARQTQVANTWRLPSEVECIAWDPHQPHCFMASTDTGLVQLFDARKGGDSAPLFTLDAHTDAVSVVAFNPVVPGLVVTASHDKTVKLWSVDDNKPSVLATKKLDLGQVFSASFFADSPFVLAAGGETGKLKVWDCRESDAVRDRYPDARRGYSATSVAVATTLDDHDQSDQEEMEEDEGNGIEEEEEDEEDSD